MQINLTTPLYTQIKQYIAEKINSNVWPSHYQIPPERVLADQFNVSRITAKNAVIGLVNEGLLYRHRGKGTFVAAKNNRQTQLPAHQQLGLARNKKLIGFIIPPMEFNYSYLLFAGVETELNEQGYNVIFKRIISLEKESQAIRELLDLQVDGLVIVASPGEHFNEDIIRLILDKYPLVLVEKTMRDIKTNSVYCDTEHVGTLMVEYLIGRGFTDIGLVTYPTQFTYGVRERIFSFQSGMVRMGRQPLQECNILSVSPDLIDKTNRIVVDHVPAEIFDFVAGNPNIKAIATADALLAKYVGMACSELNRKDTVIICCDEPHSSFHGVLPAAYIDQSPFEMGKLSAQLVIESINSNKEPREICISPKLVEIHK